MYPPVGGEGSVRVSTCRRGGISPSIHLYEGRDQSVYPPVGGEGSVRVSTCRRGGISPCIYL